MTEKTLDEVIRESFSTGWDDLGYTTESSDNYLTIEALDKLIEQIENQPIEVCGITYPHVFHLRSKDGSWQICGNCLMPVQIPVGFEAKFSR